ncbi:CRE-STI-1 protein [Caenorhabditis remanei]|uniref:Stress-induced-phosphoprotein 1 n=1 Tax=Caenorhabditis remanei TaxID=31234 RepID=E3MEW0_CAERE|nr:CRE-STI-1 protein [Caenorhabditis remanei]
MSEAAIAEKDLGNAAYKQKDFETAHVHYDKAIELDASNITFYNNKAAVYFEEKKYDECITFCEKAIEVGRETRADYKLIAKAMSRAGNAFQKKEDLHTALKWFQRSLSEYRDPELVKKTKELEKNLKEAERLAYINPEIAQEEKNKGNDYFKKGDYPTAMKHYNEAVKRDPENAILYSNRAACLTKLMEFQRALEDCETCIRRDPKFVKGYIRKATCLVAMKEWSKAQRAYEDALQVDPHNEEAREGVRTCLRSNDEDPEKAKEHSLADPEVQEILRDPGMRMILEQMSNDPGAVREHLKNPEIFSKLMKLRDAGVIQMR